MLRYVAAAGQSMNTCKQKPGQSQKLCIIHDQFSRFFPTQRVILYATASSQLAWVTPGEPHCFSLGLNPPPLIVVHPAPPTASPTAQRITEHSYLTEKMASAVSLPVATAEDTLELGYKNLVIACRLCVFDGGVVNLGLTSLASTPDEVKNTNLQVNK